MSESNLTAGDNAENIIAGRKNRQESNETRNDPRQAMRSGDVNFNTPGSDPFQQIWYRFSEQAGQIRDLTRDMDDLPDKVRELIRQMDNQKEKVHRLEQLEVVIRPAEVVIRPVPDASNLSMKTLIIWLIVIIGTVGILVAALIFLSVFHYV